MKTARCDWRGNVVWAGLACAICITIAGCGEPLASSGVVPSGNPPAKSATEPNPSLAADGSGEARHPQSNDTRQPSTDAVRETFPWQVAAAAGSSRRLAPGSYPITSARVTFEVEGPDGALRINFGDLDLQKLLNMNSITPDCVDKMPKWLKGLAGKKVRIRGYMKPGVQAEGIPQFVFVRSTDMCCFEPKGRVDHLVATTLKPGVTTDYIALKPFDVVGTFRIDKIELDDGMIILLYHIDDAAIIRNKVAPADLPSGLPSFFSPDGPATKAAVSGLGGAGTKMPAKLKTLLFGTVVVAASMLTALAPVPSAACPFCSAPTLTLAEQFDKADAALLVQWHSGEMPVKDKLGSTTYEVVQVARSPVKTLEKGKKITIERYRSGKPGDLALLFGSRARGDSLEWGSPLDVSEQGFKYIVEAPTPSAKPETRIAYYLKFLENPDRMVADDAYSEFANAPYKVIAPLAKQFPRDLLRKWIVSPEVPATRLGLYGLMLGLCGNTDDADLMESKIVESTDNFRLGIEGVMGGYLLLTGEKGLETIEKTKLQKVSNKEVPFSETYSAMMALRFLWTDGNGRIPPDRLKGSMRLLLDRPEVSDLVITDLARWKDWSIQPRLMDLYGAEEYNIPSIKRSIIRFMIASTKDLPGGGGETKPPKHVTDGARCLQQLRDKDAKLVNEVERYFFLQ